MRGCKFRPFRLALVLGKMQAGPRVVAWWDVWSGGGFADVFAGAIAFEEQAFRSKIIECGGVRLMPG